MNIFTKQEQTALCLILLLLLTGWAVKTYRATRLVPATVGVVQKP